MSKKDDLTGKRFGRLTVLCESEKEDGCRCYWDCICDCGRKTTVAGHELKSGKTKSCGCSRVEKGKELQTYLTFVDGTCVEWIEKRKGRSDNTSGHTGVYITKNGKYKTSITLSGKRYHLGTYKTMEDAVRVRKNAESVIHKGFVNAYKEWSQKAKKDSQWADENPFHFEMDEEELRYAR